MKVGVSYRSEEKARPYLHALDEIGAKYVSVTPGERETIAGLTGLLVTGGGADIDPALYRCERHPKTDGPPDSARDKMEAALIAEALAADLPLLCICRGMQMFNVVRGGTLDQHIPQHALHGVKPPPGRRHAPVHGILVRPGTLLGGILGSEKHSVNSRHHQAVDQVGKGIIVSARAEDGVIEAIEDPVLRFALGCQWHPEESVHTSPGDRRILEAFCRKAS